MIRLAQLTDLPVLTTLQVPYSQEIARLAPSQFRPLSAPSPDSFTRYLVGDDAAIFVCLDDAAKAVGYASVTRATFSETPTVIPQSFAYLVDLYVQPAARHQGFARQLVSAASDWAQTHQLGQLQLNVLAANTAAHTLYTKLGFQETIITMTRPLDPTK